MARVQIRAPGHDRSRSLGWLALRWFEHFVVHGPGDVQGRPLNPKLPDALPLDDEFAGITLDLYALQDSGRRAYDNAFVSRAKGRAKSELAGFVVLWEAMGPCRFKGWAKGGEVYRFRDFKHVYQPGEPMGRTITYPFIRCLATEETQAGNTYDNVYYNLTQGPLSEGLPRNTAGLTRTILPGAEGGEIVPSTASSASKDGGKETLVVVDEGHLYTTPELRGTYRTVTRNMGKRKLAEPWLLETSTMYLPGEDSIAEDTHKLALLIKEGKIRRPRLLFDHREAPPDVDMSNEKELVAALREVYGPFADQMDLTRIVDLIWDPRAKAEDSQRYYLNQATGSADAWLQRPQVDACGPMVEENRRALPTRLEPIVLGFDGSRGRTKPGVKTDATALVGCTVADGHVFPLGVWEHPDDQEIWMVPTAEVDQVVKETFERYNVVGFYADPKYWESYVAKWVAKYGPRLKVGKKTDPISWWMTGGRSGLVEQALDQFHTAIVNREMTHNGSSVLVRHLLNARRVIRYGKLHIAKKSPESDDKIDTGVAAVLAWRARLDALAKGIGRQKQSAVPTRIR